MRQWQLGVTAVLADMALLPEGDLAGGGEWGGMMGAAEWGLYRELQRRWLLWRDEVIASGVVEREAVRKELVGRQRAWESAPHPRLEGRTPAEAVRGEQAARAGR